MSIELNLGLTHRSPEQYGIPVEETVDATGDNQVTVSMYIAHEICQEYMLPYSVYNSALYGVCLVYNNEGVGSDVTANIRGVVGKVITLSAGITSGDEIRVIYYAESGMSTTGTDIIFRPDRNLASADDMDKHITRSLNLAMQQKSPIDLSSRGYKWVDVFARKTYTGLTFPAGGIDVVLQSGAAGTYDHQIDYNEEWPIIVTEVRVYSDDPDCFIYLEFAVERNGTYQDQIYDSTSTIDMNSSSACYALGNITMLMFPLSMVQTGSLRIRGYQYGDLLAAGSTVVAEFSAWYKPKPSGER